MFCMTVLNINRSNGESKTPRVLAITGGKGGVGKTSISVNLALALSKTGSKVCLFDADTGLANINIMLGIHPAYTLEHLFTGEKSIQDIVVTGPEGLQIVPGASGFAQCVELDVGQQQRLVTSIRSLEPHYDYMLVDTAAGISPTVLHFIAASQIAAVVITPEPTSLTDAFSLLKVLKRRGYKRKVQVIVNMTANSSQAEKVYGRFSGAVAKYLGLKTEYMGSVWMDESMRTAVTLQRPVALFPKHDPSARSFYRLAERIDVIFARPERPTLPFSAYWQKLVERHSGTVLPIGKRDFAKLPDRDSQIHGRAQTQVQKQLAERLRAEKKWAAEAEGKAAVDRKLLEQEPLSEASENEWVDLRIRLNRFFNNPNTTPEQVTTLLSSSIFSYGDRLGEASVDLIHGLLHTLDPKTLNSEQKTLLRNDYARLGLAPLTSGKRPTPPQDVIEVEAETSQGRFDEDGFGSQKALEKRIKESDEGLPLESLLESIKYASLVDSSND